MKHWIFQANPDMYDIRSALDQRDVIHWRAPQYTSEITPGDTALLWESGELAGIVGVAQVLDYPKEMDDPEAEKQFAADGKYGTGRDTLVKLEVARVSPVPKSKVVSIDSMKSHKIITAPMGTVFPVDDEQWDELTAAFPELGNVPQGPVTSHERSFAAPFSWSERSKSVYPLPGGVDAYPETLAAILDHIAANHPEQAEIEEWISREYGVSTTRARQTLDFLRGVGLLSGSAARLSLSERATSWLGSRDPSMLIALMHGRVKLIGELLDLLDSPVTAEELLSLSNDAYDMGWSTRAQIDRRWYWLLGFGMVERTEDGRLQRTPLGDELVRTLAIEPVHKVEAAISPEEPLETEDTAVPRSVPASGELTELINELVASSTDTSDPDRFERVTAEAFEFLGFDATWLGGSGKTDVLLVAPLGPPDGYRVIVDCKTTASDGVTDHPIDWVTLEEHRRKHESDFIAVVAPVFKGSRIRNRAAEKGVALLDVDLLSGLLRQHAATPISLDQYRDFFASAADTESYDRLTEAAEEIGRGQRMVQMLIRTLGEVEADEGWLTAKDLYWNLKTGDAAEDLFTEAEIQQTLDALSSPALQVVRTNGTAFKSLGADRISRERLVRLACAAG